MIVLQGKNIGKRYRRNWIFRKLEIAIHKGSRTAITGRNGAGKSTLLQILASYLTPTEGEVVSEFSGIYLMGPYTELIEEMTLEELLAFYATFKKQLIESKEATELARLPLNKPLLEFSTGMLQRVKILLGFYFENEVLFLDEPTSNLDRQGINWWNTELEKQKGKTILIASNDEEEIDLCEEKIQLAI
ncbi:MAG: ATP-binding cassette domain-containing protein [Bacteroidota bacterium]